MKKGAFLLKNGRLFCNWRYPAARERARRRRSPGAVALLPVRKYELRRAPLYKEHVRGDSTISGSPLHSAPHRTL